MQLTALTQFLIIWSALVLLAIVLFAPETYRESFKPNAVARVIETLPQQGRPYQVA